MIRRPPWIPDGAWLMTYKNARLLVPLIVLGAAFGWYEMYGDAPALVPAEAMIAKAPPKTSAKPKVKKSAPKADIAKSESKKKSETTPDANLEAAAIARKVPTLKKSEKPPTEPAPAPPIAVATVAPPAPAPPVEQPRTAPITPVITVAERTNPLNDPRRLLTTEEVVAKTEGSVALVRGEKAFGTGFLIRPGLLVTNAHVISQDPVKKLKVIFTSALGVDREPAVKGLLYEDVRRDLAFLAVDTKLPPLDIESAYRFRRGQEVTIIGNPGTGAGDILENAVSRGVMSTLMTHKNQTFFQMSVSINPGNSGGPVIGSEGRVVGVATLKNMLREGIAGCIPVADLAAALKRVESQPRSAGETVAAIHDIRTAVTPLDDLGSDYAKTIEAIARLMDEGTMRGVDPGQMKVVAVRTFRRELGDKLHQATVVTHYPALCRVDASPQLPASAKKPLHDLWQNLLDLQKTAESPKGSSEELRHLAKSLKAKHEKLVDDINQAMETVVGVAK